MSRRFITLPQTASWDLVVAPSGVILLVVPHGIDADRVIAADDGVVLDGDRPMHLKGSERIVPYVRRGTRLVLVQAGERRSTEKVVPVVIHGGTVHARRYHGESAAA